MKYHISMLLILLILGCSGGGGGNESNGEAETVYEGFPSAATEIPLIIIQIEFNDIQFTSSNFTWSQKIFGGSQAQLNHYFLEISKDGFVFSPANENYNTTNDGIITVRLNKNHPGDSAAPFTTDLVSAATIADTYIDFSAYDLNNDTRIQKSELQIMYLVAGGEVSYGDPVGSSIWAHAWCLNGATNAASPSLDGTFIMQCNDGGYSRFGEHHGAHDATIGIIAHELGHAAFSLPDLYDTDGSSEGIGIFGLMGSGSWAYKVGDSFVGQTPTHMSAYSKIKSNFIIPTLVSVDTLNLNLKASDSINYQAIRINTQEVNEYFLLEHRSKTGYDAGLFYLDNASFQGGLAIWHIDESQTTNTNENRKLVDLVESDSFHLDTPNNRGDRTNLFYTGNPAGGYTGVLHDTSTPDNTKLNSNGANTNIDISTITTTAVDTTLDLDVVP